jgi:hypothetical protein
VTPNPDIIPEGLPDHLPEGERLLWQGRPEWKRLAIEAFHVRKVAAYFVAVMAAQAGLKLAGGATAGEALAAVPMLLLLAIAACAILAALAYASARTTSYSLTSKRALMRVGIALPVIINLPLRQVDAASFAVTSGDVGSIILKTGGETRLAYLLLWPHARPWHITRPQPAFRCIRNVEAVAAKLAFAIGGHMPVSAPANQAETAMPPGMLPAE